MEKIALADIIVTNPYLRTTTDIESLKKSIETVGLINPLTVNQQHELLAGGRRYQALKELGYDEVKVIRLDLTTLEQELVSIDENLVRKSLNKLEFEQCLNRGRDIYEQLNPTAMKVNIEDDELSSAEKKIIKEQEESDTTSFAAITAEKTGLSKSVIKSAIKRDAKSSEAIKNARGAGELSASQVNEIIKLDLKEQEAILPYVKEKTVKDVKKIINQVKTDGLNVAITNSLEMKTPPKELKQLNNLSKRCSKTLSKIMVEDLAIDGEQLSDVLSNMEELHRLSEEFIKRYDFDYSSSSSQNNPISQESLH